MAWPQYPKSHAPFSPLKCVSPLIKNASSYVLEKTQKYFCPVHFLVIGKISCKVHCIYFELVVKGNINVYFQAKHPQFQISINNLPALCNILRFIKHFIFYYQGKITLFILDSNEEIKFDFVSNGQDQNHIAYQYLRSMLVFRDQIGGEGRVRKVFTFGL